MVVRWMFPVVSGTMSGMDEQESERQGDWARLGKAVVNRRIELGMRTRESFADTAGLSSRILSDIEKARKQSYSSGTLAQLEQALQWEQGSIESVLEGGTPVDLPPRAHAEGTGTAEVTASADASIGSSDPKYLVSVRDAMATYLAVEKINWYLHGASGVHLPKGLTDQIQRATELAFNLVMPGVTTAAADAAGTVTAEHIRRYVNDAIREHAGLPPEPKSEDAPSQDEYELAGGDVAYRRGMTEERRRRMVEKEPEDIPDADGPEHGA
ncbi:hypothetical protein CH298_02785 [Rhodococcoides fascians]|uniref:hypothetical protein n=1 Tax=Rhodococcoides fascians TaxID=1828 RepID=UPI000B9B8699|nr:hypothetical protein [Rhodococcus fascians]OZE92476.1 hypothetical protein CH303_02785 [Rhodococcus fascians]OZF23109.1 hypothetical protein CH298_02785 [Rhodococcus fascians]OZF24823.1 hypothetical protein CH297_02785 [Rhodococcus fascians]OZF72418.1 hypothetical protein CH308_02790 [Rhodococcus fascians]OZF73716.1 hypothetical protein CH307_02785 [Rhodococcus fascians]